MLNSLIKVQRTKSKIQVNITTLDSILKEYPKLIKIDAEGYEKNILSGGRNILSKSRDTIIILEYNKGILARKKEGFNEIFNLLLSYGFNIKEITNKGISKQNIVSYRQLSSPFTNIICFKDDVFLNYSC